MDHYFAAVRVIRVNAMEVASSDQLLEWHLEEVNQQLVFYWRVDGAAIARQEENSCQIAFCLCFHVKGSLHHLCQHYFLEAAWLDHQLQTVAEDLQEVYA